MHFDSTLFLTLIITGPVVLVIAYYFLKRPPRKINAIYGYRTRRSMEDQDSWDFAQNYSARLMVRTSWLMTALALISLNIPVTDLIGVIIALTIITILMVYPIILTERALKDRSSDG